jgi:hypothetical protein
LAVEPDNVARLVNAPRLVEHDNLTCDHADIAPAIGGAEHRGEPSWFGFGIVVQESDPTGPRARNSLIICGAETAISFIPDNRQREMCGFCEFFGAFGRTIGGAVIDQNYLERG